jgi:uncharacterized protein (TIGR03032 family)
MIEEKAMAELNTADASAAPENPFHYVHTSGFPGLLEVLGASLLVSTYQAGKLVVVRSVQGRLSTLLRSFEQPMGLAVAAGRLALGTRGQIWFLNNASDIARQLEPAGQHDACFLPRHGHVTGDIRGHEIAWGADGLWIVNTRFSCLCTLHPDFSFVPRWRPPFISELAASDRCHLNGLAMDDGQVRYVTALGATDEPEGWRPGKATGGCLIDVPSGALVAQGLSMPHSPRLHDGYVWLLDSGTGRLVIVDPANGRRQIVAELPGFPRGLAFHGGYVFVGLSRIRETATFGGLPLAERKHSLRCGVWCLDQGSGRVLEWLEFDKGVEEIFDVQVLPGVRFPTVVGFQKATIHGAFVLPPAAGISPNLPVAEPASSATRYAKP